MVFKRSTSFAALIAVIVGLVSTSATADTSKYTGEDAAQMYAAYAEPSPKQFGGSCWLDASNTIIEPNSSEQARCMPMLGAKKTAIIWGDSAIAMYARDFKIKFAQAGYSMGQLTSSACPPFPKFHVVSRPFCEAYNDRFIKLILQARPSIVVMGWHPYTAISPDQLATTLNLLTSRGIKVVIVGSEPLFHTAGRLILAARARKDDPSVTIDATENPAFKGLEASEKLLRRTIVNRAPSVGFVSVLATVCPNEVCILAVSGTPMYFDTLHVTPLGSALNTERLFPQILR